MKQELRVIALALAMALIFLCGVAVGRTNVGTAAPSTDGGSQQVGQQSQQEETTKAPSLADQAGNSGNNGAADNNGGAADNNGGAADNNGGAADNNGGAAAADTVKTSSGLERPADGNYAGMCEAYNKAINDYRAYKGVVTLHKVENTVVNITELPAVAKPLESTLNGVIGNLVKPVDETFTFENGKDQNDPNREIGHKMIPWGRDAKVTTADLAEASIKENADGGYTITVKFVSESATFDGTTSTEPVHHMTAMDPLNLGTLDVKPLEIFSAEMTYPGATTSVTVDSQGRLIKLENKLPLEGKGNGGMGFIKATIGIAGQMDSVYDITYA
ncbi:MAG: hypothetical protein IKJ27_06180 [Clostridia bacterium]|nr:hypothetical protein [Clostridia bacterium]